MSVRCCRPLQQDSWDVPAWRQKAPGMRRVGAAENEGGLWRVKKDPAENKEGLGIGAAKNEGGPSGEGGDCPE